jgi:hypothetical protein
VVSRETARLWVNRFWLHVPSRLCPRSTKAE